MQPLQTYRIETERLVIRCCETGDAALMLESMTASRAHLRPWMTWADNPISLEERKAFLHTARVNYHVGTDGMMVVFDKTEQLFIGCTGLHPRSKGMEIGYWMDARQVGQGYATETASALTKVAFEVEHLERIAIHCDINNAASNAIPPKLGYRHETTLKAQLASPNGLVDEMVWSLLRSAYETSRLKHFPLKAFDVDGNEVLLSYW